MPIDRPTRCCDLVLKGGTTSGVLYPSAVHRFAEDYELVGLGGSSAGAIAAAAAAAAELARRNGTGGGGFDQLRKIPDTFREEGRLRQLFTPEASTRKLFQLIEKLQKQGFGAGTALRLAGLHLFGRLRKWERAWTGNFLGCSTGMALDGDARGNPVDAITPWLTRLLDEIAGIDDGPLTFGHLWRAEPPRSLDGTGVRLGRSIDARFVTTSLTYARPVELPFATRRFGFRPEQWRRLFPERVVEHLIEKAPDDGALRRDGVVPLPAPEELPLVVAVRMSLALPFIFTAVPLEAVDYEQEGNPLRTVWFSDGGITSNLPIHRFDALLPRWPTLAINLQYYEKEASKYPRPRANVIDDIYLPTDRNEGSAPLWLGISEDRPDQRWSGITGFVGSILASTLRWHDNSYLTLPGYKGRVAEIWLHQHEGGSNWDMPKPVIDGLVERGREAADRLVGKVLSSEPFDPFAWNDQRLRRFRTAVAGLAEWLGKFDHAADSAQTIAGNLPLERLLEEHPVHPVDLEAVRASLDALRAFSRDASTGTWQDDKSPRPHVEIGTRAPIDMGR